MHESAQIAIMALLDSNLGGVLARGSLDLSQTAGAALIAAVWQGAVIAVCLGLSLRLTKRVSAGLRFALWSGGFLAVLGLPFLPAIGSLIGWHRDISAQITQSPQPWLQLDARWSIGIAIIWIAASIYRAVDLATHAVRLRRLWISAVPLGNVISRPAKLWGRKPIEICTSGSIDHPSVIGFFAPRILVPEWLFNQMTREELDQILLHETEHLRRGDDWTNLLQKLSLVVFPLNPVLLWMERRLCLEREMACDEAVIRVTRAPKAYAACLTSLAERGLERRLEALSLGAWQRKPELVQRVHSILFRRRLLSPLGTKGAAVLMAGGLLMGTVELARCPQLVTFTASTQNQLSASVQPTSGGLENAADSAYHDSMQVVPVSAKSAGDARMVELRATIPVSAGVPFKHSTAAPRPWKRQTALGSNQVSSWPLRPKSNTQTLTGPTLKADLGDTKPLFSEDSGFVVLTTWEEIKPDSNTVESTIASGQPTSGSTLPATCTQADADQRTTQVRGRVAVTQFVFRVVPASYRSGSQAIVPLRNGWLVIQL